MGRKKINKEYKRTIGKIGSPKNHSYYVTLPISFVRNLNWSEGKQVTVKKIGRKVHITDA